MHIADGGTEVHQQNFALRDVSPRLLDAQSLHVVVMLLLDGPAVLVANASEDVRRGTCDIRCKLHQFLTVSGQLWLPITPVIVNRHSYGCTHTSRHLLGFENRWVVFPKFEVFGSESTLLDQVVLRVVLRVVDLVVDLVVPRVDLQVLLAIATRLICATRVGWAPTSSSKLSESAVSAMIS